jgi:diaminopimelate decarboxylase
LNWLRQRIKAALVGRHHARNESARRALGLVAASLPPELWDVGVNAAGHLDVAGHDVVELCRRHGTPLHIVNRRRLERDFTAFATAFRSHWPRVEVGYSYKTNPLPGVIRELHAMGAWAEVISQFELWLALQLGVAPERIIYNGPAKSDDGLRLAVGRGVRLVNIDNLDEIDRIGRVASELGRRQSVGVRLVSSVGWAGQFGHGIASGEAAEAFARLVAHPHLDPCGLHIHLGTGLHDVAKYLQAIREVLEFARTIAQRFGVTMRFLDFGGGFGVPTVRPMHQWDTRLMALGYPPGPIDPRSAPRIDAFAEPIVQLVRQYYPADPATAPTLLFEPGRAITSSAQMLALGVLAVKPAPDGTRRVILDGGRNIAIPTGYELHELLPASRMRDAYDTVNQFYGPLCHPGDVMLRAKRFPAVRPGDVVVLMDTGAYFVPNQMNFSNPRPAAIMVDVDRCEVIRERETFENIVQLDRGLAPPRHADVAIGGDATERTLLQDTQRG